MILLPPYLICDPEMKKTFENRDHTMAEAQSTPSSVLQSLPAEVQKNIEDTRAACREYLKNIDDSTTGDGFSGDYGLEEFTLSGVPAVMVDNLKLCGGNCYKGANCSTAGSDMAIYVRTGSTTWKTAHADGVRGYNHIFLSLDWSKGPPAFRAMVLGIPGDSKDCPKHIRSFAPNAFKKSCDVIVRWNGTSLLMKRYTS